MSIPSNGWLPQTPQSAPAFDPALPNAYGEQDQLAPQEETSFSDFLFGDDGIDMYDVLDVVNPLQHIPVVNTIYREMTGDEIGYGARVAGGTLFGGVIGLAGVAVTAAVDAVSGRDVGEHAVAMFQGDEAEPADTPLLASWFAKDPEPEADPFQEPLPQPSAQLAALETAPVADAAVTAPEPEVQPIPEPEPQQMFVGDGMAHFSAFSPNGQLMSPAELAARLNQQRADQQRSAIDRAETFDDEAEEVADQGVGTAVPQPDAAPVPEPTQQTAAAPVFPHNNGQAPALGNWFDGAVMDALQKYQALQDERTGGV
jgi:hypothetical protein